MIREIRTEDIKALEEIHARFYRDEFNFTELFDSKFICNFVVFDDRDDTIITAGGIRSIAECILVTDKSKSVRTRRQGLYQVLDASRYFSSRSGFNQLHAFVQEPSWKEVLTKVGFRSCKGDALVIGV